MGDAGEVAQDHAEAMVERDRDADLVVRPELLRLADEEAVVEDVVVGERRPLGRAGGAAGELDVDRLVELEPAGELDQARALGGGAQGRDLGEGDGARPGTADLDHGLEPGQAGAAQLAGCAVASSGASSRSMAR